MSPMVARSLTIEHALLGFLQPGPMHGYELHRQMETPAGLQQVWYLKQAQLYALLGKLEEAGYITSTLQPQETRPARRVFQMTTAGQAAFQNWLTSAVPRPRQMRQEFQAKLYFARLASPEICLRLIYRQSLACQGWLQSYQRLLAEIGDENAYAELLVQYRLGQIQAMLDWLDACQAEVVQQSSGSGGDSQLDPSNRSA